jgi:hypothetical protein
LNPRRISAQIFVARAHMSLRARIFESRSASPRTRRHPRKAAEILALRVVANFSRCKKMTRARNSSRANDSKDVKDDALHVDKARKQKIFHFEVAIVIRTKL